jgi:hypothetical protein
VLPIEVCRFLNIVARAHPYIWEYQAVQTALDRVVVSIVPTAQFSAAFADKLAAELETFLGPDLRVQVEAVQQIPREPSGKRLLVKSRLDLN